MGPIIVGGAILLGSFLLSGCSKKKEASALSTSKEKPERPKELVTIVEDAQSQTTNKIISEYKLDKVLVQSWQYYKTHFIESDGRPIADPDKTDIDKDSNRTEALTSSEAVSYTLLRATLINDRETFDRVWIWTQANLQRKNLGRLYNPQNKHWEAFASSQRDNLFAWRYCPTVGGQKGGVLSTYDYNPASDADQDIAAALLLAGNKWGNSGKINYHLTARQLLADIWDKETVSLLNKRILLRGYTEYPPVDPFNGSITYGVSPSYFRPTYYQGLFAEAAPQHPWTTLIDPSYLIIERAAVATVHDETAAPIVGEAHLSPESIALDENLNIRDFGWRIGDHKGQNDYFYGADAFRTLFWLTLQQKINPKDEFASKYVHDKSGTKNDYGPRLFLEQQLNAHGTIYSAYNLDGSVHWQSELLAPVAVTMCFFWAAGDQPESKLLLDKIMANYQTDGHWNSPEPSDSSYYRQNWVWFSLYLISTGKDFFKGLSDK